MVVLGRVMIWGLGLISCYCDGVWIFLMGLRYLLLGCWMVFKYYSGGDNIYYEGGCGCG